MSDLTGGEQPQDEGGQDTTLKARVAREVAVTFGRHNLITEDGRKDDHAIAEMLFPVVSAAVVNTPADRAKVGVTPEQIMEQFFAELPNRAAWAEFDGEEAEFHEAVYRKVQDEMFRVLSPQPSGLVQSMLGANGGMMLCVMVARGGASKRAYVTRNRKCINDDALAPALRRARTQMDNVAALASLAIDRVPEHGKWFEHESRTNLRLGLESATSTIKGALEASTTLEATAIEAAAS